MQDGKITLFCENYHLIAVMYFKVFLYLRGLRFTFLSMKRLKKPFALEGNLPCNPNIYCLCNMLLVISYFSKVIIIYDLDIIPYLFD